MPAVRLSRYEFAAVEQDAEGGLFLDVPAPISKNVLLRGADRVTVGQGEDAWTIAWRFYRSTLDRESDFRPTSLFDVICAANDIVDPLEPLEVGRVIFVPSLEVIFGEVRVPPPFYERNRTT